MGSFNLGRIKGDKGDRGETGPKGDTGAKGEKGDRGDNGRDGLTPVFTVGETVTLAAGEKAYVEIDTQNPEAPVISFRIPAGYDGKDALGDMLASVYDPEGIKGDIYKYARDLFDSCVKVTGGALSGALKATETSLMEGAVRNISVRSTLPENGAEGDLCIITSGHNFKKLGDCLDGDIILLEEEGEERPYMIVARNYHTDNSITLLRYQLTPHKGCFNTNTKLSYPMCEADIFMESIFKFVFPESVRKKLIATDVENGALRHCFLLSDEDFTKISFLNTKANRIAKKNKSSSADHYITRTSNSQGGIYSIGTTGEFFLMGSATKAYYRPAIVLPSDLEVINTAYEDKPAVKLYETRYGLYVYMQGEWKECACL